MDDREVLLEELRRSTRDLRQAVEGLSEDAARAKPAEGRWSAIDCIEHVTLVDQRSAARVAEAPRLPDPIVDLLREETIRTVVPGRRQRLKGPDMVMPAGRHPDLASAFEAHEAVRAEIARLIELRAADLRFIEVRHPVFGPLSGYEALLLVSAHALRHANQIREIRTELASRGL